MLLDDYSDFIGCVPVVLVDTPEAIRCLHVPTEHLGKALRFAAAADYLGMEVVFNVEASPVDGPTAVCLDCDGDGCHVCRGDGTVTLTARHAVQVASATGEVEMHFVTVDDLGESRIGEVRPVLHGHGPLLDGFAAVRGMKRRGLLVQDLIEVGAEQGWLEVWR